MSDFSDPYDAMGIIIENIDPTNEFTETLSNGVDTEFGSLESMDDNIPDSVKHSTEMATVVALQQKPPQIHIFFMAIDC